MTVQCKSLAAEKNNTISDQLLLAGTNHGLRLRHTSSKLWSYDIFKSDIDSNPCSGGWSRIGSSVRTRYFGVHCAESRRQLSARFYGLTSAMIATKMRFLGANIS